MQARVASAAFAMHSSRVQFARRATANTASSSIRSSIFTTPHGTRLFSSGSGNGNGRIGCDDRSDGDSKTQSHTANGTMDEIDYYVQHRLGMLRFFYKHKQLSVDPSAADAPHTHSSGNATESSHKNDSKRARRAAAETIAHLDALETPVAAYSWKRFQFEHATMSALKTFKALHGHVRVPVRFDVQGGDPAWPQLMWGFRLGRHVS